MDPLESHETNDDDDNTAQNLYPLTLTTDTGEVLVKLEGSHTTSTETEAVLSTNKKNVTFEDENEEEEINIQNSKENISSKLNAEEQQTREQNKSPDKDENSREYMIIPKESQEVSNQTLIPLTEELITTHKREVTESVSAVEEVEHERLKQTEAQNVETEGGEIFECFEKIVELFDSFTKSSETLELPAQEKSRERPKSGLLRDPADSEEPQRHRSHYEEFWQSKAGCCSSQTVIEPTLPLLISANTSCAELVPSNHIEEMALKELRNGNVFEQSLKKFTSTLIAAVVEKKAVYSCSISTATSNCEVRSLGCQTQISDHISINDLSLLEGSSLTSRSEQPNSLNNYAQAENACVSLYSSQQDSKKQPLTETLVQQPLKETPPVVEDTTITTTTATTTQPQFSVITIEANATPSSADLRRQPFCQRLWEVVGDFCAATLLCLQVNRDCIFCIGFFAAFVVSASFLTAFFYHTLILNPILWQAEDETLH